MEYIVAGLARTNDLNHVDAGLESECDRLFYWIGGLSTDSSMEPGFTPPRASASTESRLARCLVHGHLIYPHRRGPRYFVSVIAASLSRADSGPTSHGQPFFWDIFWRIHGGLRLGESQDM